VTPAVRAAFVAYTQCMRSHGIHDFPDPTIGGGGISFETHGGPGSDLDRDNPSYQAASAACQSLLPGGGQPTSPPPPQKLAIEVEWARCMRAHGLPNFPDPNSQGAFDSSRMDDSSPAFTTASNACKSYESSMGPVTAVPGHG
jgi:hypothetical protein